MKKLSPADLVTRLATELAVTLKPGGGLTTPAVLDLPELGVSVEVTMRVQHLVTAQARFDFQDDALARLAHHERGAWEDGCDCYVRDRGSYIRGSTTACKKPVIGVVVSKARWPGGPAAEQHLYSFRCHVHLQKRDADEPSVVYRSHLGVPQLKEAREKRKADIAERDRLTRMTPEERIAEDAKAYGRADEVKDGIAGMPTSHSYRCDRLRMTTGWPAGSNLSAIACTCDLAARQEQYRSDLALNALPVTGITGDGSRENPLVVHSGPPCPCDGDYCTDPTCNHPDPALNQPQQGAT